MRWMRGAVCFLTLGTILGAEDSYQLQIEKDRKETQEFLRSEKGPLRLAGRYTLKEGDSRIGSDANSEIPLPSRAPAKLGTVHRHGRDISFEPAPHVSLSLNGKPVSGQFALRPVPSPEPSDRVTAGDFTFSVRPIGDAFVLLVTDAQSQLLKAFKGPTWFPIDTAYRVQASFQPVASPRTITVQMTDGNSTTYQIAGELLFQCAGQVLRLQALTSANRKTLFVPLRDETSGKETYGGGRFLEADLPRDSRTILDFNKAYNPYCAYNPFAICPVVPRENRLPVAIRAGETLETNSRH
jgi:uncharacterized protein (DUF1684 family)